VYLDFGMMSEAPPSARYAIIAHVVHLVNKDYLAMCYDYYTLDFMDPDVDTTPIAPALAAFFDEVLADSTVSRLNFRTLVDGLGGVLFQYPFRVPAYYALILRSLTVLEGLALSADKRYNLLGAAYPYVARRLLTDPAPELRSSLEDLILQNGRLRWNRLENLIREGSKSYDFDSSQIWTLAEWVLSDGGRPVRKPLANEIVRLVDSYISNAVRKSLVDRVGSEQAQKLVPETSEESEALERLSLLAPLVSQRVDDLEGLLPTSNAVSGPGDIVSFMGRVRSSFQSADPQIRRLLQKPGMQDLIVDVQWGLVQRALARGIKLGAALTTP
jgi:predicted unusual protein kinase regulating ubiquinone biosynthesis (AarF/ABC1/UbiB family)